MSEQDTEANYRAGWLVGEREANTAPLLVAVARGCPDGIEPSHWVRGFVDGWRAGQKPRALPLYRCT